MIASLQLIEKLNSIQKDEMAGMNMAETDYYRTLTKADSAFLGVLQNNGEVGDDGLYPDSYMAVFKDLDASIFGQNGKLESFHEEIYRGKHFSNLPVVLSHHGDFRYRGFEYFNDTKNRFVS